MNNINEEKTVPPFPWETKIVISSKEQQKLKECTIDDIAFHLEAKLPPPPCPPEKFRASLHDNLLPPPPRVFHLPLWNPARRGLKKNDDPFYIAYIECTKSRKKDKWGDLSKVTDVGIGLKMPPMSVFSCKKCCSVVDGSIIRATKPPNLRAIGKNNGVNG